MSSGDTRRFTVTFDEVTRRVHVNPDAVTQSWLESSPDDIRMLVAEAFDNLEAECLGSKVRHDPAPGEAAPFLGVLTPSLIAKRAEGVLAEVLPGEVFVVTASAQ